MGGDFRFHLLCLVVARKKIWKKCTKRKKNLHDSIPYPCCKSWFQDPVKDEVKCIENLESKLFQHLAAAGPKMAD